MNKIKGMSIFFFISIIIIGQEKSLLPEASLINAPGDFALKEFSQPLSPAIRQAGSIVGKKLSIDRVRLPNKGVAKEKKNVRTKKTTENSSQRKKSSTPNLKLSTTWRNSISEEKKKSTPKAFQEDFLVDSEPPISLPTFDDFSTVFVPQDHQGRLPFENGHNALHVESSTPNVCEPLVDTFVPNVSIDWENFLASTTHDEPLLACSGQQEKAEAVHPNRFQRPQSPVHPYVQKPEWSSFNGDHVKYFRTVMQWASVCAEHYEVFNR